MANIAKEMVVKVGVNVGVSREQAERCLRILEMFLDDNPDIYMECERKTLYEKEERYTKHYLRFLRGEEFNDT